MADVKLPGVGPVSKKWLIVVVAGSAVTVGYVVLRRKSAAASAASTAASGASSDGTSDIDSLTGDVAGSAQDQADLAALQAGGGYDDGDIGDYGGGEYAPVPVGTQLPGAGGFTTNGEWAQQAETDLGGVGVDQATLSAALGAYLTGRSLTADQQSLVDQAIAEEGYPPVSGTGGYPPAMKTGGGTTTATKVKVPNLVGETLDTAKTTTADVGLKLSIPPGASTKKANVITSQHPAAGTQAASGSTVTVKYKTK